MATGARREQGRAFLIAALYASLQALLPPVGGFLFVTGVVPWLNLRTAVISVAVYTAVLGIACALPFKYMDREVDMGSHDVALSDIPRLLEANNLHVLPDPEVLPAVRVALPTSTPSLNTLRSILLKEVGFDLRKMPTCGNAVSLSFLWGTRSGRSLLLLTPVDHAAWDRLQPQLDTVPPTRPMQLTGLADG